MGVCKYDRAVLARLTEQYGFDIDKVAAEMGCPPKTIWRIWHQEYGWRGRPPMRKVDRARLEELTAERGYEAVEEIAAEFDVHVDSIYRIWRDEYGYRRRTFVTPEQHERIAVLAREGLPSTWIAEDVGLLPATVRDHRPKDAPFDSTEWNRIWPTIFNNEDLLLMHWSVAPKPSGQHEVEQILEQEMRLAA